MITIRECRFTLPLIGGRFIRETQKRLCEIAGGYTMTLGVGGWVKGGSHDHEKVYIFDVAVAPGLEEHCRRLAINMACAGGWETAYFRSGDGRVEYIDTGYRRAVVDNLAITA